MNYYNSITVPAGFAEAVANTRAALSNEGFGVITEIDVQRTMKDKLGIEFRNYLILGACNPSLAHKALETEDKIGVMLPCNVIVQETFDGEVEIAAMDPLAAMSAIGNDDLSVVASEVTERLNRVLKSLSEIAEAP